MRKTKFMIPLFLTVLLIAVNTIFSQKQKPNILVIMADDLGQSNISAYTMGLMGYQTPNIDRIAHEGALFTDYYAEQSCTAGRAAFITGQLPFRVGLSKVGMPGAKQGLSDEDPTTAQLLKNQGYVSGQFGKNHLGDRNEFLPTLHGFDEYAGVLYHLNALEEPENVDYPKDPKFFENYGPRDAIHTWATDVDDTTVDPRFGKVGKQKIQSTGQVTKKRMETYDDETLGQSIAFMRKAVKDKKPFFIWHNTTRTHVYTHLRPKYQAMVSEIGFYGAAITEFDDTVGALTKELEDLGIDENTIIIVTTDNGAEKFSWPDGGTVPFHGEKATTWEGGFRVPCVIRYPNVIKPGTIINEIVSGLDWMPTLLAAAGEDNIAEKLIKGYKADNKTFKVHLDGYNQLPLLKGEVTKGPREEIHYISDDGDYCAFRYHKWKISFLTQEANGLDVWDAPYVVHRFPRITNLREDPYEQAQQKGASFFYQQWQFKRSYLLVPAQVYVGKFLKSFDEFPPRGKPASFSVGNALKTLQTAPQGN